jgi:hypothetical protein
MRNAHSPLRCDVSACARLPLVAHAAFRGGQCTAAIVPRLRSAAFLLHCASAHAFRSMLRYAGKRDALILRF